VYFLPRPKVSYYEEDQGTRDLEGSLRKIEFFWDKEGLLFADILDENKVLVRGGYDKEDKHSFDVNLEDKDFRKSVLFGFLDLIAEGVCHPASV